MDFFAAQDDARRRSRRLIWLLLAAVSGIIVSIYLGFMRLFAPSYYGWWNAEIFVWVAGIVITVVGLSSLGKIVSLRSGGSAVAESLGGRRLDAPGADPDERRLLNIVEEMAIAAGVPVPAVYVLPEEDTINAFAAGFSPDDAALGFTAGALHELNRDELQGVVAHEFAHILNGDMRLNIHLIGVLFGILVLTIIGQGLLRATFAGRGSSRRKEERDGTALALMIAAVALLLLVVGAIGVFFGRLIQSAVSRQREFLADAAAAQFTRNPDGLANALRKIADAGSRVRHPHSQDVAHLFFANGLSLSLGSWFATHPPLEQRIRALAPSWDGSTNAPRQSAPAPEPSPTAAPFADSRTAGAALVAGVAGALGAESLAKARSVRHDLEERCGSALHDPLEARSLVGALIISDSLPAARPGQMQYLRENAGEEFARAVESRLPALEGLPDGERLPLIDLTLPALGLLDSPASREFLRQIRHLVLADGQITWFAFVTGWMIRRHLEPPQQLEPVEDPRRLAEAASIFLGFLASLDAEDEGARAVFGRAAAAPGAFAGLLQFPEYRMPDYLRLEDALRRLGAATFALRKDVLEAAARVVMDDNNLSPSESEMMRLAAAALDCPSPLASSEA